MIELLGSYSKEDIQSLQNMSGILSNPLIAAPPWVMRQEEGVSLDWNGWQYSGWVPSCLFHRDPWGNFFLDGFSLQRFG